SEVGMYLLFALVRLTDLANRPDGHLRGQTQLRADVTVDQPLQFDLVGASLAKGDRRNGVASGVEGLQCPQERGVLVSSGSEFDKQGLFHSTSVSQLRGHVSGLDVIWPC